MRAAPFTFKPDNGNYGKWPLRDIQDEAVEAGFDAGRQPPFQPAVVEVETHMGQNHPARLDRIEPSDHLLDVGVGGVALALEAVDDPGVHAGHDSKRRVRKRGDVGRIRERPSAQPHGRQKAVILLESLDFEAASLDRVTESNFVGYQDRPEEIRALPLFESVVEPFVEFLHCARFGERV